MTHRLPRTIVTAALVAAVAWMADAAAGRSKAQSPVVVQTTRRGFDWGDAAIGAGAAFGIVLAVAGVLLLKGARNAR